MSDWIGLAVILLIILGGLFAAARLGTPPERISEEEFQRRVHEGAHTRAAMFALQQWLHPKGAAAVAVQQDLKHGYYNKKKIPGEGGEDDEGEADAATEKQNSSDT